MTISFSRQHFRFLPMALLCTSLFSATAYSDDRTIVVNGNVLNAEEAAYLDQLNGESVPSGNYWLDTTTGLWGYAGGPAQGYLRAYVQQSNSAAQSNNHSGGYFEDQVSDFMFRHGYESPSISPLPGDPTTDPPLP